ncbi:hypothetical protein DUI87_03596 [Hirundo rustica rustica]|uniref:ribonuclease H n=1 Tax=Hirundo rustica rustica TaxID=333673 RepID=A0A3M0LIU2_HIRRU|nr:hypothetical protein DUI87_03596 [Hirundo rustica rustica]
MVDVFSGRLLVSKDGRSVDPEEALQNKVVGLYFSAGWCSPCRDFTPVLCNFYVELLEETEPPAPFEVVFISSDHSAEEMVGYMRAMHGDWLALPFHDPYKQQAGQTSNAVHPSDTSYFAIWPVSSASTILQHPTPPHHSLFTTAAGKINGISEETSQQKSMPVLHLCVSQKAFNIFLDSAYVNYPNFINSLHAVVESQIKYQDLQQKMILEAVQSNANDVCKRIILGLPVDPPPTLDLLIETCMKRAIMDPGDQRKPEKDKWRLLHDLRKINEVIEDMGSLQPVRVKVGEAIILHHMDDVLVCAPNDNILTQILDETITALAAVGFELQQEKVKRLPPWKYLGLEIANQTITPQKLAISDRPKTLKDFPPSAVWILELDQALAGAHHGGLSPPLQFVEVGRGTRFSEDSDSRDPADTGEGAVGTVKPAGLSLPARSLI